MTEYERAVLRAIALGPEPTGWYKIEQRLSREALDVRERLPDVLTKLERDGHVQRDADGWRLTEPGRRALEAD